RRRVAVTQAAVQGLALAGAGHVAGALGHDAHLRHPGAGVCGGDVAPAETVDEVAHGLEQRLALVAARIADDHRLATAQRQARQRRLVGHAAGQAQHVAQGLLVGGVAPHAEPPRAGPRMLSWMAMIALRPLAESWPWNSTSRPSSGGAAPPSTRPRW